MSAKNWRVCPKCFKRDNDARDKRIADTKKLYGRVTADEYRDLIKVAEATIDRKESMREDYEIGIDEDGLFYVDYRASCEWCGFTFNHKHEQSALETKGKS